MSKKLGLQVKYHHLSSKAILKMMEQGLRIEFPSDYYLQGDVNQRYIRLGTEIGGPDGVWNLTLQGVKSALADARDYELKEIENSLKLERA